MFQEPDNDGWEQLNDSPSYTEEQPYFPPFKIEQGLDIL